MIQNVTFIGSGNIAHWMAYSMCNNNICIKQIYSRHLCHAQTLAAKCGAEPVDNLSELKPGSDLYLFMVKDDSFDTILPQLPFRMPLAAHTAGSLSISIFKDYAENYGIIYPYQSLSKSMNFNGVVVPLSIEANNKDAEDELLELSGHLSDRVAVISEKQRRILHRAAIFGCNFTNAMYAIAHDILAENGIDWQMIMPLLQNTLDKVKTLNPHEAQTGPARRRDMNVISLHADAIEDPLEREIYLILTDYIIRFS